MLNTQSSDYKNITIGFHEIYKLFNSYQWRIPKILGHNQQCPICKLIPLVHQYQWYEFSHHNVGYNSRPIHHNRFVCFFFKEPKLGQSLQDFKGNITKETTKQNL
jgi:hypothetical protein